MKQHFTDERTGISYTLQGDYYLPDLALPAEEQVEVGIWGQRCVRRSETTAGPLKSDTLTAENRHPFRWSDSWRNWRGDRHAVSPHAVCFIP